jgi:NAD(P)H-dependent flavin oxidoreductase YrpB (nitropropane dioxygenase family)
MSFGPRQTLHAPTMTRVWRQADFDRAHVTVGEAVGLMHDAPPAAELIRRITAQAAALRWPG